MVASNAGGNAEIMQEDMTGVQRAYVQRHHTLDLFGRKYRALYYNLIRGGCIEPLS